MKGRNKLSLSKSEAKLIPAQLEGTPQIWEEKKAKERGSVGERKK